MLTTHLNHMAKTAYTALVAYNAEMPNTQVQLKGTCAIVTHRTFTYIIGTPHLACNGKALQPITILRWGVPLAVVTYYTDPNGITTPADTQLLTPYTEIF